MVWFFWLRAVNREGAAFLSFGNSSSDKRTTNNTTNTQTTDQSYRNYDSSKRYDDSYNTYTDLGAIEAGTGVAVSSLDAMVNSQDSAFEFGSDALAAVGRSQSDAFSLVDNLARDSLSRLEDSTSNALGFMSNVSRDQNAVMTENVVKYLAIAAGVVGVAMFLKGGK